MHAQTFIKSLKACLIITDWKVVRDVCIEKQESSIDSNLTELVTFPGDLHLNYRNNVHTHTPWHTDTHTTRLIQEERHQP